MKRFIPLILVGLFFQNCKPELETPDILITHATMWSDGKLQDFDAITIQRDRIHAVGQSADLMKQAGKQTRIIDAKNGLITPGFIDAHLHFLQAGFNLSSVQLRDASTPQEFITRIKQFVLTVPKGSWITGGDWNHELWGGQLPERGWIDSISPDHPIAINRLDGHMILCNSKALLLAGITDEVKKGGWRGNSQKRPK